jgi:hypothetical protein
MKRTVALGAIAVALSLSLAAKAGGQTYRNFAEEYASLVRNARWTLGPLIFSPALRVRDLGYDDNVYFEGPSGRLVRDYGATISPELKVYVPFRGTFLFWLRDNPEYVFFLRESRERALTNSYGAGARTFLFHRFSLDVEFGREAHRQRVSSELPVPADDIAERWQAGFHLETARGTALGFTVFQRRLSYGGASAEVAAAPLSQLFNRVERGADAELYYQLFTDSYLFLIGGFVEYAFDDASQSYRDAVAKTVSLGIRFPLLGRLRGTLSLGYKRFEARTEGLPPYNGFRGDTRLDFQTGRIVIRLDFKRDLVFSAFEGAGYFIEDSVTGGVSLYLTRIFSLDYNYSMGRGAYPERAAGLTPGPELENGRKDTHSLHGLGFTVRLSETLGLSVAWNAFRWGSTVQGFDRRRNFIGANLTSRF